MSVKKTVVDLELDVDPQPEGGFTVTCPALPGLITEGDTLEEVLSNVSDALLALLEAYQETGREFPRELVVEETNERITLRTTQLISV